jgi:hypothetical protein
MWKHNLSCAFNEDKNGALINQMHEHGEALHQPICRSARTACKNESSWTDLRQQSMLVMGRFPARLTTFVRSGRFSGQGLNDREWSGPARPAQPVWPGGGGGVQVLMITSPAILLLAMPLTV